MKAAASTRAPALDATGKPAPEASFFPVPEEFTRDGFLLVGTVLGRIRREFPAKDGKPPRYNITLAIQTADGLQRPERWSDTPSPSDVPERGERIVLPVAVRFYQGKGGMGCRLTWGGAAHGEEF